MISRGVISEALIEWKNAERGTAEHSGDRLAEILERIVAEMPPFGTRALAPILHPDGSGWIDFDGGVDGDTVVTLRVVETTSGEVTLQVNLWGQTILEEVE